MFRWSPTAYQRVREHNLFARIDREKTRVEVLREGISIF
jgi:hypothetical protein